LNYLFERKLSSNFLRSTTPCGISFTLHIRECFVKGTAIVERRELFDRCRLALDAASVVVNVSGLTLYLLDAMRGENSG